MSVTLADLLKVLSAKRDELKIILELLKSGVIENSSDVELLARLVSFKFGGFLVMAVTIADLIAKRDEFKNKRKERYDLETSIGTITVKQPTIKIIEENLKIEGRQGDVELIYECVVEPNLKDKDLQQAYGCIAPSDIVPMIFKTGEIGAIASAIMRCAGYGQSVEVKIHEEVKNS